MQIGLVLRHLLEGAGHTGDLFAEEKATGMTKNQVQAAPPKPNPLLGDS